MLPAKTLTFRAENAVSGIKTQKDRVTVLACSNVTEDHKLPLMVIGKAANPTCLKKISITSTSCCLPCTAWVETNIFADRFHNRFFSCGDTLPEEQRISIEVFALAR